MLADRTLTMCAGDVAKNIVAFNRSSCDWRRLRFAWLYCRAGFSLLKQGGCYEISYAYFVRRRGRQCHRSIRQTRSSRSIHFGRAKARGGVLHGRRGSARWHHRRQCLRSVANPCSCRALVLDRQRQGGIHPGDDPRGFGQGGPEHRSSDKKIRLIGAQSREVRRRKKKGPGRAGP